MHRVVLRRYLDDGLVMLICTAGESLKSILVRLDAAIRRRNAKLIYPTF